MNPQYFGDSYDIVKRYFCGVLKRLGYAVVVEPMATGDWHAVAAEFYGFIGAEPHDPGAVALEKKALFIDPDTGVRETASPRHVALGALAEHAGGASLVFAFDQSFSRAQEPRAQMARKMDALTVRGCHAFYYDSHARFLFLSRDRSVLDELRAELRRDGLPEARLVGPAEAGT